MKPGNAVLREKIAKLTLEEREKLEQYAESVKEIKKEINNLLNKDRMNEEGGDKGVDSMYLNTEE